MRRATAAEGRRGAFFSLSLSLATVLIRQRLEFEKSYYYRCATAESIGREMCGQWVSRLAALTSLDWLDYFFSAVAGLEKFSRGKNDFSKRGCC